MSIYSLLRYFTEGWKRYLKDHNFENLRGMPLHPTRTSTFGSRDEPLPYKGTCRSLMSVSLIDPLLEDLLGVLVDSLAVLLKRLSDFLHPSSCYKKEGMPVAFLASTEGRPAYNLTKELIEQHPCMFFKPSLTYFHPIRSESWKTAAVLLKPAQLIRHIASCTRHVRSVWGHIMYRNTCAADQL